MRLTQRKPLEYNTRHHPNTSSTLCNKRNKNTNPIISRQDYHLTQPYPSEEKQTNKNSAQISPYKKLTTNLRRAETKRKKEFNPKAWENETSNTITLKNNEKAEKYYTNEGTN